MKFNKLAKYLFFIIILGLVICGIYIIYGDKDEKIITVSSNKKDKNISYNFTIGITNYDTMNPFITNSKDCNYISKLLYRNLLNIDNNFNIVTDIAKEYSKLDDTSYIIKINENIKWSNGKMLNSNDVKFTIDSLKKFNQGQFYENVENVKEVLIIDDLTLKILLINKDENFEYKLCIPILAMDEYNENTLDTNSGVLVTNGNYKIIEKNDNKIIISTDTAKEITIKIYDSVTKLYTAFVKKEVDFIYTENTDYENYIGKIGYNANISTGKKFGYIICNVENVSENVRRALSYGINKQNLIYDVFCNKYNECNGIYEFKGIEGEKEEVYSSNECIKQLNGTKVELSLFVINNNDKLIAVANEIKSQLEDKGIIIDIIKYRKEDFDYLINLNNFDLILLEDELSLDYNIEKFMGDKNLSNFNNNEVKYLLNEINSIRDKNLFKEKYNELLKYYQKDMPFISLYYSGNIVLTNSCLMGNFEHNWYNLFYNIDRWYLTKK